MRRRIPLLLLLAACQTRTSAPTQPPAAPPTSSPASMSHGEAKTDNPAVPLDRLADAPPRSTSRMHHIRLRTVHVSHVIAPEVVFQAWTFDSIVPGPVVRVTVGDTVDFTLINGSPIPHSIDFHAAELAPSRAYVNVMPKDSIHFSFVARVPGAFMYRCGTAPAALHIASGMYGALIVDPVVPRAAAREFVLVQSEFYFALARVYEDGFGPPKLGVQTASIPVGGGMEFEVRLAEPGLYPFVTHSFGDATKGAVGVLRAGTPAGSASH